MISTPLLGMYTNELKIRITKVWSFLKILKIEQPNDPEFHLGMYSEKNKSTNLKSYIHSSVRMAALFLITKVWKQSKCPLS